MFEYYYENGIVDYVKETVGDDSFTTVETWEMEREGRDRADKEDYQNENASCILFLKQSQYA